ncbi:MAG TPA: ATP-binding cassette domain-containing protein [Gemmatimonadaceae bacterium]|jgi:osmoprotectant transport system ATP-binding protein|nr:ATP-binding cassette domain-containing protein [Gemmatimonadaceae bacterium]
MLHTVDPSVVLRAERVGKRYASTVALAELSLDVHRGELVALVGESGAGKSTLLRCFNRLVEPDEGVVLVDGVDARSLDPVALRRRMGYVPQDGGLLPHWTVRRNAALVPWLRGDADAGRRAERALQRVGLAPDRFGERRPAALSGGERQRVALARALAADPDVVLLDEPFGALDALTRADAQTLLLTLRRELHPTAVLVTHDLREALRLADRVAVLRGGRLEQVGPPAVLTSAPATPYVAALLRRIGLSSEAVD